jgi:hypothetical protein
LKNFNFEEAIVSFLPDNLNLQSRSYLFLGNSDVFSMNTVRMAVHRAEFPS